MTKPCEHCGVVHEFWWDCAWQREHKTYGFIMGGDLNPSGHALSTDPLKRAGMIELGQGGYWNEKRRGKDLRRDKDEEPHTAISSRNLY
jgi:hypothetical protein